MISQEHLNWHRLMGVEGLGGMTFLRLLETYGSATKALEAVPMLTARGGRSAKPIPSIASAEQELATAARLGVRCLYYNEPEYPELLRQIPDAPPILYTQGDISLLRRKAAGIVGARHASTNSARFAGMLAQDIGKHGIVTVSGLARGIDAAAHQASLTTGTIAVVAGGVDVIYPKENTALHHRIAEQGLIVASEPLGTQPTSRHFPRRNRIIAGLAQAVVVVEAARQSGSLITARLANEYGRDVYAVPHFPLDPRSEGTNHLIAQGARVCLSASDILASFAAEIPRLCSPTPAIIEQDGWRIIDPPEAIREKVVALLGATPVSVDVLLRDISAAPAEINMILLELELAGRLERTASQTLTLVA